MDTQPRRDTLKSLFEDAVEAVKGQNAVATALAGETKPQFNAVLAVGKAACSMYLGAVPFLTREHRALIVTKHGHIEDIDSATTTTAEIIESSHPIPDADSLHAGDRALSFIKGAPADERLLVLVSGGASALLEVLADGITLADVQRLNSELIAGGADIATINERRSALSRIKGGQLLGHFSGHSIRTLAISDVAGDDITIIGSGIGACTNPAITFEVQIVASNAMARETVCHQAAARGLDVVANEECLYGDVNAVATRVHDRVMDGPEGLYVFGGEPTIELPAKPGVGGRNQALALSLGVNFSRMDGVVGLAAGTDGTDGPTPSAGGFFEGRTLETREDALAALRQADSGSYLARSGDLYVSGPTGTNVMDLVLVLKTGFKP